MKRIPWLVFALALAASLATLLPRGAVLGFDLDAFSRLPVLEGGRVKPLDSVARNSLLMIRGQQGYSVAGRAVSADEWLLDLLFRPETADAQPVFVINDPDLLGLLELKGPQDGSERYYSFKMMLPRLGDLERQANAAQQLEAKARTRFQGATVNLYERVLLYDRLQNTLQLAHAEGLSEAERQARLVGLAAFRPLPPLPGKGASELRSVGEALSQGAADPALAQLMLAGFAWAAQDAKEFNAATAELIRAADPAALQQASREQLFNRAQPFYLGMVIYLLALLCLFVSWLWQPRLLQGCAFALLSCGALVHTAGLAARIVLQGRPPVTNLYSSAVFVGWGAVVLGLVLERMYRRGFGTAVAAAAGFVSLIVAHHLLGDGDTMEMMRAVLDSNLWLATHVVTITIGYSGTFLAGAIAIGWTLRQRLPRPLDAATSKTLVSMTYGTLCFALFFSFIGTVLGGIWADQSWGRFWGWDPKENGALLIVLWNAVILHARFGGFVRERGVMAMAIFGNVITSLSWFGVNMLGVGLHSYGFMESAFWALAGFIAAQLALIAVCLLPTRSAHGAANPRALAVGALLTHPPLQ